MYVQNSSRTGTKVRVSVLFAESKKKAVLGAAVKGFMYARKIPLQKDVVPDESYASGALCQLPGIQQT
jgi:hypothetical protein